MIINNDQEYDDEFYRNHEDRSQNYDFDNKCTKDEDSDEEDLAYDADHEENDTEYLWSIPQSSFQLFSELIEKCKKKDRI